MEKYIRVKAGDYLSIKAQNKNMAWLIACVRTKIEKTAAKDKMQKMWCTGMFPFDRRRI
jgi:hypothetical protein